jgi:predicted DNA-binding transcriptional regulator AlpA
MQTENFLTEARTAQLTTLSRATINRKVACGEFPAPIYISARRKAWRESAVRAWMDEQDAPRAKL